LWILAENLTKHCCTFHNLPLQQQQQPTKLPFYLEAFGSSWELKKMEEIVADFLGVLKNDTNCEILVG